MIDADTIRQITREAVIFTMTELGYNLKSTDDTIPQAVASRLVGRRRLERAMADGRVRWFKDDMDNPRCRVFVNRSDVMKLKK